LPKQQSTSFWSQGILGVNGYRCFYLRWFLVLGTYFSEFTPFISGNEKEGHR
jgi:hypothetical protein